MIKIILKLIDFINCFKKILFCNFVIKANKVLIYLNNFQILLLVLGNPQRQIVHAMYVRRISNPFLEFEPCLGQSSSELVAGDFQAESFSLSNRYAF